MRLIKQTAIVMFDTRTPEIGADNYWSLAAQLNLLYAQRFGYDFIYYLDDNIDVGQNTLSIGEEGENSSAKTAPLCYLNGTVARGSPWGKLPALADALGRGYERVLYVDSDAFLRSDHAGVSVDQFFQRYGTVDEAKEIVLWLASNAPWEPERPNAAFQLWVNRPQTMRLLRRWWRTDVAAQSHPYEQHAIWEIFDTKTSPIAVLEKFQWMEPEQWEHLPGMHIPSIWKEQRAVRMRRHLGKQSVTELPVHRIDTTATAQRYLE